MACLSFVGQLGNAQRQVRGRWIYQRITQHGQVLHQACLHVLDGPDHTLRLRHLQSQKVCGRHMAFFSL